MNLEPVIPYVPFFTGRAFHAALEFYYRDGIPLHQTVDHYLEVEADSMAKVGELWPAEKASFDESIELIKDLIFHYELWQAQDQKSYADCNLEFVSLETPFNVPMPLPGKGEYTSGIVCLEGRFDGIVRHKRTGKLWVWETKTARSIPELVRSLVNDEQSAVYMHAAGKLLDEPIAGVLYNIVRKKAPSEPRMLQNGSISKAANTDTTAFHYLSIIKREFPDWSNETILEEYEGAMAQFLDNESKFFLRYPVYHSETEIRIMLEGIYHTALEMANPALRIYPSPSWVNCNFCAFKSPCLAQNAGSDYGILLESEYQHRASATSMRAGVEEGEESVVP